ncbi:MAG: hypothetical protein EXS39_02230 [Opitutaceae bacterium]|nr:hypothetical protein [Opitutaceae bacterium]
MNRSRAEIIDEAQDLARRFAMITKLDDPLNPLLPRWPVWRYPVCRRRSAAIEILGSKLGLLGLAFGVLALVGVALRLIVPPISLELHAKQLALSAGVLAGAAGQRQVVVLPGGFRALAADIMWLRTHACWERHDLAGTEASLRQVTGVEPRCLAFWLNGARMMAYDMPEWRIARAGGAIVSSATRIGIEAEQARLALAWLDDAQSFHPQAPAIFIERAFIHLYRMHDPASAAEDFRRAAEQPGAPYYAARLHAEMLRRLGRKAEACAWLTHLHPTLPRRSEAAATDLVLARIRALESEMGMSWAKRYQPPVS